MDISSYIFAPWRRDESDRIVPTDEAGWRLMEQVDIQARLSSRAERPRVMCESDWLAPEVPLALMIKFLDLIRRTPSLDWMLPTAYPTLFPARIREASALLMARVHATSDRGCEILAGDERFTLYRDQATLSPLEVLVKQVEADGPVREMVLAWVCSDVEDRADEWPRNVWIGIRPANQRQLCEMLLPLLSIPAQLNFIFALPMTEKLDLQAAYHATSGTMTSDVADRIEQTQQWTREHGATGLWVVCGGGEDTPLHPNWVQSLRDECVRAKVPFCFLGWGAFVPWDTRHFSVRPSMEGVVLRTRYMPDGQFMEAGTKMTRVAMDNYQATGFYMIRLGAERAGRTLDGREWIEMPQATERY